MKYLVFAKTRRQFDQWVARLPIDDRHRYFFVSVTSWLSTWPEPFGVIFLAGHKEHKRWPDLWWALSMRLH